MIVDDARTPSTPSDDESFVHALLTRHFATHLRLWISIGGGLLLLDALIGDSFGRSFWPVALWGVLLCLHFLCSRAFRVDDEWVRGRTEDLRLRSYDLSHIVDIEDRARQGDASASSSGERPKDEDSHSRAKPPESA